MLVHFNDDEMTSMTHITSKDTEGFQKKNEILIPTFDIHYKTVGNEKGSNMISTTAFDIPCNPKESYLLKTIIKRCLEDPNNDFTFIPYGPLQMTNAETYRRQIIFQNCFIVSMIIIPIYGVTKTAMTDKVEETVYKLQAFNESKRLT